MSRRPRPQPRILFNTPEIELWPADLLRARGNRDARLLARAHQVLRRKRDGCYLAASVPEGMVTLLPGWQRDTDATMALDLIEAGTDHARSAASTLGLDALHAHLDVLGLDADGYAARTGLAPVAEPTSLVLAGRDRYRRPLWLTRDTARAWSRMRAAALDAGVVLDAVSGYRSHAYQLGIFARKRERGLALDAILEVNAAPGFSEHHAGTALDISTPGEPAAEPSFEATPAFAWLGRHAGAYGFSMSYPRDNPHGIVYEPWHWNHRAA
ncbi:M15 family metallopeptidase [Luteimonas deserti]|uniref:D-alanyl-D-alanine carboxypeptidase family protein n=1 Tax=Luteimonas deserti TaxID=2752306 RepID=A0A7Z0QP45_9GAMM|nr:M15 family metallopeptidase [Luteimonas deserti]NYZ61277.1 D-alanyl-D-alanine carboxypeptidase family protein [Luteimonas deserti]